MRWDEMAESLATWEASEPEAPIGYGMPMSNGTQMARSQKARSQNGMIPDGTIPDGTIPDGTIPEWHDPRWHDPRMA